MKKKICSIALSLCLVSSIALAPLNATSTTVQAKAKKVKAKSVYYVPGSSYAYHSTRNCRTLRRSKTIKKITLKKAKALKLRACKVCH